ncbi:BadF/BadG/BcrA/BcrD ATPase family protein [Vallitalea maricola]|uniref:BadF/BadG/BcrA/BcrD ATPase family protein n=1 Tax=Vallitalea maricola TaxID=3074433 RepID=A0ACB5UHA7_9FIRM|nr:BadF/BadG/BcrA/BcrD ATPase family protein [Vallitalea sp. AN17-2]
MNRFLGIDGGGTKTEFVVCDESGYISDILRNGPTNPIFIDEKLAFANLDNGINEISKQVNREFGCLTICIPGLKQYGEEISKKYSNISKKVITGADELNTYYSAIGDCPGVVVLSGTGSFVIGKNEKDEFKTFGGWGPLVGDEGSGYYIGLSCLKEVIRAYENNLTTTLSNEVEKYFNINNIIQLRKALYRDNVDREKIAGLCKVVYKNACIEDKISLQIINEAAIKLANLAKTAISQLRLHNEIITVVLTGGVSKMKDTIIKPFTNELLEAFPKVIIQEPRFEPSVGALIMAMKEYGITINEDILDNLQKSYQEKNPILRSDSNVKRKIL